MGSTIREQTQTEKIVNRIRNREVDKEYNIRFQERKTAADYYMFIFEENSPKDDKKFKFATLTQTNAKQSP